MALMSAQLGHSAEHFNDSCKMNRFINVFYFYENTCISLF